MMKTITPYVRRYSFVYVGTEGQIEKSESYIFVRWRNISKHLLTLEGGLYEKVIDVLLENDEIELNKVSNRFWRFVMKEWRRGGIEQDHPSV